MRKNLFLPQNLCQMFYEAGTLWILPMSSCSYHMSCWWNLNDQVHRNISDHQPRCLEVFISYFFSTLSSSGKLRLNHERPKTFSLYCAFFLQLNTRQRTRYTRLKKRRNNENKLINLREEPKALRSKKVFKTRITESNKKILFYCPHDWGISLVFLKNYDGRFHKPVVIKI